MENKLDSNYWNSRYINENTGWDLSSVSRPIKEYLLQINNFDLEILIPGAGNAYEAKYAFELGFKNTHILDFAELPIKNFKSENPKFKENNIHLEDFFLHEGQYDLIIEQTFFCAIDPDFRKDYAHKMYNLLKPNGKLVGVLFDCEFESGPPFSGNKEEYVNIFSPLFTLNIMQTCYNSIKPRDGKELFIILTKK